MLFNSLEFLFLFLPSLLVCYFIAQKTYIRNVILLVFSLFFYWCGGKEHLPLMLFMILLSFLTAIFINKTKIKKLILVAYLCVILGVLGYFKYFNFIIENLNTLFKTGISTKDILLPIGISFYTFQCISYVIDVYRENVSAQKDLIKFATYISLFPQLIAGPIVRYETVNKEIENRNISIEDINDGIRRFVIGLGKKVIIANNTAIIADNIFNSRIYELPVIIAWIGVIAYALQIYFDFSGYSDMAIGLGRIFGFHFLENFNYPYIADSITDFWRRWHISLSSWFKDYVYIPLGGNRVKKSRWFFNIFVVWFLTGMWHGATWNFILWGLYFGTILVFEKLIGLKILNKMPKILKHIYAIVLILLGWVIFRADNIPQILSYFKALVDVRDFGGIYHLLRYEIFDNVIYVVIGIFVSVPLFKKGISIKTIYKDIILIVIFAICLIFIVNNSYSPFIYFRF